MIVREQPAGGGCRPPGAAWCLHCSEAVGCMPGAAVDIAVCCDGNRYMRPGTLRRSQRAITAPCSDDVDAWTKE